ncbi:MAG: hypothetical protein AAF567_12205 [Actinomycetota bacterium]
MRAALLLGVIVLGLMGAPAASAQDSGSAGGGLGGTDAGVRDKDGSVESSATARYDETATNGPGLDNGFTSTTDADLTAIIDPAPPEPPCLDIAARQNPVTLDLETYCTIELDCGWERVDDGVFGEFSGGGFGRMAQWLGQLGPDAGPIAGGTGGSRTRIVYAVAGEPADDEAMPVMRWCERSDNLQLITTPTVVDGQPRDVAFSWDLTDVWDNYPVIEVRRSLLEEVRARLQTFRPTVGTVPPLSDSRTWVGFPTWFWVEDPLEGIRRFAVNDRETVRVEIRATLDEVRFDIGDESLVCAIDDMQVYVDGRDHPIEDAPPCSVVFDELDSHPYSAHLVYVIEERVAYAADGVFPDEPWTAHPDVPSMDRDTDLGTLEVAELQALVVNAES